MVIATKPGTSVPVKVMRDKAEKTLNVTVDELDLDAEQNAARRAQQQPRQPAEQGSDSFGLTLQNLTPQHARRLQMPAGQTGARRSPTSIRTDRQPRRCARATSSCGQPASVANAAEAGRELQKVPSGRIAQMLVWRGNRTGGVRHR